MAEGTKIYFQWNNDSLVWNTADYTWIDCFIVTKIILSLGGEIFLPAFKPWEKLEKELHKKKITKEESQKFLEVLVKVNGLGKSEIRELEHIKKTITIRHIRNTFAEFAKDIKVSIVKVKKL